MSNLVDTLLNVTVLGFIGLLVWLYFKEPQPDKTSQNDGFGSEEN